MLAFVPGGRQGCRGRPALTVPLTEVPMHRPSLRTALLAAGAVTALAVPATASAQEDAPTLVGRALLPGELRETASQPAPAPFPAQPLGGFSALVDGGGALWAMPDNGYGAKGNSQDFLLRVYLVDPEFETAEGGAGDVDVLGWVQLRDPDRRVPFPIVTEGTTTRLLTGSDFDLESFRVAEDGTLWFGEEFGPFLLHTDATGRVLEAPIALPGVESPDSPFLADGEEANLPRSGGFEGMALSADGETLYPTLEQAVVGDPQRRRWIYEFDVDDRRYTGERWAYRTEQAEHVLGDLTALDRNRLLVVERDNQEGEEARFKRVYLVDLRRADRRGYLVKREVLDLLDIADPDLISLPGREGDLGIGPVFTFPYVTVESVLPLGGERLALVNDTNFGSTGRNPQLPDDSDFIVVEVPGLADPVRR
jgi:hypothetical protein